VSALLVVTPDGPDADALCASLKDRGFTVHSARNGAEAVGVAIRHQPDVVLMDPSLSAMDRWHAVKRLNTEMATARIPVLTLASDASSPAGLQRVLSKIERTLGTLPAAARGATRSVSTPPPSATPPPTSTQPRPAVASLSPPADRRPLSKSPAALGAITKPPPRKAEPASMRVSAPPASVAVAPPLQGAGTPPLPARRRQKEPTPRLLVVDDNALNRDMLSRRLKRRDYEVLVAEDGESALQLLKTEPIDLVLLDWMMPGLSGIDVLARIRATTSQVELPVIMATAKTEADDIVEALKAEANDYVTKPLNFDVVHARIRTQLNLARAHRELVASEQRFRALLENTGDMIVQYEADGHVHYVSPASRILLGWEADELKKRSFYDWIHPIDRRELEEQQRKTPTLPPAFTFIARMQRQDNSHIWVETSCRVLREQDRVLIQAACRDVTEHMESLSGDEPPLPLGGDIMAHPGWRGMSSKPAPEREAAPAAVQVAPASPPPVTEPAAEPVVPLVVVTSAGAEALAGLLQDGALEGGPAGVSGAVEKRLLQWLAKRADE